ncbi:hypothetical protein PR048_015351, partial [Dryococelus australis]
MLHFQLPQVQQIFNMLSGKRHIPVQCEVFTDADSGPSFFTDRPNLAVIICANMSCLYNPVMNTLVDESFVPIAKANISADSSVKKACETTHVANSNESAKSRASSQVAQSKPSGSEVITSKCNFSVLSFPKSGKMKTTRKKTRHKCAVLTNTLEKQAIENEYNKKKIPNSKPPAKKKKVTAKSALKIKIKKDFEIISSEDEEDDETCVCLVCIGPFSKSKPGEEWVQCLGCKHWAHFSCVNKSK